MAVFTDLSFDEARAVALAHGLPTPSRVVPIAAGSVNSNFFLETEEHRWFLRIYEEQGADGVAYEWALLEHLRQAGLPVPVRVAGPAPLEVAVAGKPVAIFEVVGGQMSCQRAVTPARARQVGRLLARAHRAGERFPVRREGRFTLADIRRRLRTVREAGEPALDAAATRLEQALDEVEATWPGDLPLGVVHGDLFRDNVHWEGDRIVAVIDWESASDGALVYDLAVTALAWCHGDAMDWVLGRALVGGYDEVRALCPVERDALRVAALLAAARFTATRITDFTLREGVGERVHKDWRRFMARLDGVRALAPGELAGRLLGGG